MFTFLHALAKRATLMITVAREGDDLLRVNVTPVPTDTKSGANLPTPLSLLATPAEFDADFETALATWQAPKRSLVEQAQAAAGSAPVGTPALPPPKADSKNDKPGRKGARGKADADQKPAALQDAGDAAGAAGAAIDQAMAGDDQAPAAAPGEPAPAPAAAELTAADLTLDLF